jgi:hypothetical protein
MKTLEGGISQSGITRAHCETRSKRYRGRILILRNFVSHHEMIFLSI